MAEALIALGANLPSAAGSPQQTVLAAAERLQALSVSPVMLSSLWVTRPVDCPPGSADFVNAVARVQIQPDIEPEQLLGLLHEIEAEFGRSRSGTVNEPRCLDLDLISVDQQVINTSRLQLPHPRAHLRLFVLCPLAEIAPDHVLPGQRKTVSELVREIPGSDAMHRITVTD